MADAIGSAPGFVVLRQLGGGRWQLLGEVMRRRGLPARAARTQAIMDATKGRAKAGKVYAAVLRSEWQVAMDWTPPQATSRKRPLGHSLERGGSVGYAQAR